jgi:GNAT superfamily N-acetyltransferase
VATVDVRAIDPHDERLLRAHWEVGKAADDHSRPYDFHTSWEAASELLTQQRDDLDLVLLGAFVDGGLRGAAHVQHSLHDNLHSAHATYYVHPDWQRRGIGRALAEASYDVARGRGRRTLTTEAYAPLETSSPGVLFGEAMGFTQALVDGMKVVDLPETEHLWDALEAAAEQRRSGYRIVTWQDHVPEEHLTGYCRLNELFFDEAPMGELEVEPERWDAERVRRRELRNERAGRQDVSAGAVAPDGTLVGVTEIAISRHAPWRGFQSGTLVAPEHRGHALGMAIKLANHRQVRQRFPQCRMLMTGNADVNAPMNAVNDRLGYREVERCVEMHRPL